MPPLADNVWVAEWLRRVASSLLCPGGLHPVLLEPSQRQRNQGRDKPARESTSSPTGRAASDCCSRLWLNLPGSRGQNIPVQRPPQARQASGEGFVRTAFHLWAGEQHPAAGQRQQPGQCQCQVRGNQSFKKKKKITVLMKIYCFLSRSLFVSPVSSKGLSCRRLW